MAKLTVDISVRELELFKSLVLILARYERRMPSEMRDEIKSLLAEEEE